MWQQGQEAGRHMRPQLSSRLKGPDVSKVKLGQCELRAGRCSTVEGALF